MKHNVVDITGGRFGFLTACKFLGVTPRKQAVWSAICDCGAEVVVRYAELARGDTKSCGCLLAATAREKARASAKHQQSRSAEYRVWRGMRTRCENPRNKDWANYGGRGITVCERWQKFENFLADMGPRPQGTSIDRINNDGHYEPGNCRWAQIAEQNLNRRSTRFVDGKSITQWGKELGVSDCAIRKRLAKTGSVYGNHP